ncbi:MAG TPA: nucleoside-diphosphate sugar epimerase, partial [Rhodospirillaceae bacterium]|nr:nucleoside-diphosphate sugar epimerase [Rhodospirillaceae bacterium]
MKGAPIWVLTDDRPGNVAQCLGVAEALGEDFIVKPIAYSRWAALPNALRGRSLLGLTPECRASLQPPWPRLVIAAGRRTAPLARWCKRQLGTRLVQIMDPGWPGRDDFDLIARPLHDGPILRPNVLQTLGSCHRVTPALLASEKEKWASRLPDLPRPWVALLVGGATKEHPFGLDLGEQLVAGTVALARQLGASILVTT